MIRRNTRKLLEYLKRELEIELAKQEDLFHAKTLAQIFFENRIYKRIEECGSVEEEYAEVHAGLAPFRHLLRRDVTDGDIDKLLALPVRRISRFDIEKNQREIAEVLAKMEEINKNLGSLKQYAIRYLKSLLDKYGDQYPRRTEIEHLEKIDRTAAALNNIKVGWDRRNGYVGTAIKSDDTIACNEFDRFVCVSKDGSYKVIALPPEKLFIGKLYDFRKYDASTEFGVIYRETVSGKYYGKRTSIGGFILDKEYMICPEKCKLELLTPRSDAVYTLLETNARGKMTEKEQNLMELPVRTPKARGVLISSKQLAKITHKRYLTSEELEAFRSNVQPAEKEEHPESDGEVAEEMTDRSAAQVPEKTAEKPVSPEKTVLAAAAEKPADLPDEAAEVPAVVAEKKMPAPEPAEMAPPAEEPAPGDVPEPLVLDADAEPVRPKRTRIRSEKPEKPAEPKPEKSVDDDGDEFGMIQSEFGF